MRNAFGLRLYLIAATQSVPTPLPDFSGYWTADERVKAMIGSLGSALSIVNDRKH
jgi:hypothetical protein